MIDFKLDFYEITKCGYYLRNANSPQFGSVNRLLEDYEHWIQGKTLAHTKTFESDAYLNLLPVYCFDFLRNNETNDALLVTWNETYNRDGTVFSVNANSNVGHANVDTTDVPDGNIPGYATYFWFIPEHNLLCSLRPETAVLNGHTGLKAYFKRFIDISPSFIVLDDRMRIIGHAENPDDELLPVIGKFDTRVKYRETNLEFLRNSVHDIRKIISVNQLHHRSEVQVSLARAILNSIFLGDREQNIIVDNSYRLEFNYNPTIDDLDDMIVGWNNVNDDSDIGFRLEGEQTPVWLSKTYEKHQVSFDIDRGEGEVIGAEELLNLLQLRRNDILGYLENI